MLLRFLAAALVIFGHSWATANNPGGGTDWLGRQTLVFSGTVAVDVFFWVSGFLVTMSFARRHSLIGFAVARILRIFPGLIVCVLFSAVVLGAAVTTLSAHDYLVDPRVRLYVLRNATLTDIQWFLPGVFEGNRYRAVVQLVALWLPGLGPWRALLVSFPLALVLAAASWHLVEKPMLRWKPRGQRAAVPQR